MQGMISQDERRMRIIGSTRRFEGDVGLTCVESWGISGPLTRMHDMLDNPASHPSAV